MKQPKNIADVRRYLGMINQLSKFSPDLSPKTKPLQYVTYYPQKTSGYGDQVNNKPLQIRKLN